MRIGIDVGGTFTNVVLVDRQGRFYYQPLAPMPIVQRKGAKTGQGKSSIWLGAWRELAISPA